MQLPIASHKNPNNEYIYWQYYCDIRMHACEPLTLSKPTIWETCVGPSILHIIHGMIYKNLFMQYNHKFMQLASVIILHK